MRRDGFVTETFKPPYIKPTASSRKKHTRLGVSEEQRFR